MCEDYAEEYNILFNHTKYKLLGYYFLSDNIANVTRCGTIVDIADQEHI